MVLGSSLRIAVLAVAIGALAAPCLGAPTPAGLVLIRQPGADGAVAPVRMEGVVTLRLLAAPHSRVRDIEMAVTSGRSDLDAAAQRAVRRWRYVPNLTGVSGSAEWLVVRMVYDTVSTKNLARSARR